MTFCSAGQGAASWIVVKDKSVEDYLVRIMAKEAGVRGLACVTTELTNEAIRRHEAQGAVSIGLARGLASAALMGALLKVQQRVALKFEGGGLLKKMVVESNSYGKVRGYATPIAEHGAISSPANMMDLFSPNGLLTVVLPKVDEAKPRRVEIH